MRAVLSCVAPASFHVFLLSVWLSSMVDAFEREVVCLADFRVFLVLWCVLLVCNLPRTKCFDPAAPPAPNINEMLGDPLPWCCGGSRKRRPSGTLCYYKQPRHYFLVKKILARNPFAARRFPQVQSTFKSTKAERRRAWRKAKEQRKRDAPPAHWRYETEEQRLEDFHRNIHRYLHLSYIMIDAQFGVSLDDFCASIDPLAKYETICALSHSGFLRSHSAIAQDKLLLAAANVAAADFRAAVPVDVNGNELQDLL